MNDRMTDERLSELLAIQDALGEMLSPEELELGQAMKAERKSLNDCARDNTKFRQRIRELEESLAEWVADGKAMEKLIRELKIELDFVVQAWVKPQDELTPDEISYMMSAREALADD